MNVLGRRVDADFRWPWELPAWDAADYGEYITMQRDPLRLAWWRFRLGGVEDTLTGATGYSLQLLGLRLYILTQPGRA